MNFAIIGTIFSWITGRTVVFAGITWFLFGGAWGCWIGAAYLWDGLKGLLLVLGSGLMMTAYQLAKPASPVTPPTTKP